MFYTTDYLELLYEEQIMILVVGLIILIYSMISALDLLNESIVDGYNLILSK